MPQCESLNTYHMSRITFVASKNMKFRLSQNLTKFDAVTRLHENIPTVKSVSSSEIYKNSRFLAEITILHFFRKLKFSRVLQMVTSAKVYLGEDSRSSELIKINHQSLVMGTDSPPYIYIYIYIFSFLNKPNKLFKIYFV